MAAEFNQLAQWAADLTYKPEHILCITVDDVTGDYNLLLSARVPDADEPEEMIVLTRKIGVWPQMSEEAFLGQAYSLIAQFEEHERGEWLRHNGKKVFDPHAN